MLTKGKLIIYEKYLGDGDAFTHASKREKNIISGSEFAQIERLLQDIKLIKGGLAAKSYEDEVERELERNVDSKETREYLYKLVEKFLK